MSVSAVTSPSQAAGTTSTASPRARTRREAILESALEIIAREGFHRASVAEIASRAHVSRRSEEHTSELQSLRHLVCRLLLEKKKKNTANKKICEKDDQPVNTTKGNYKPAADDYEDIAMESMRLWQSQEKSNRHT